jgi:hypothetical protein
MFKRPRSALVAVILACATARTATAQDLAKLSARLLSANRAADAAKDSAQAIIDSIRDAAVPRDSLAAGGLMVRFAPGALSASTRSAIERGAPKAWALVQQQLGAGAARAGRRLPIIVAEQPSRIRIQPRTVAFTLQGSASSGVWYPMPMTSEQAEEAILDLTGTIAALDEPMVLKKYAGEWIPASPLGADRWIDAAVDLSSSDAAVARDCVAGSIARCESALALTDVSDPLAEWYSPADWRVLVSHMPVPNNEPPDRKALRLRCLTGTAPDVCALLERENPIPRPLIVDARRTLIGLALAVGGPEAYDRLLAADGTVLEILATTSGISADELVARWRTRVLAASPDRVRPRALEATTMIAWTLIFAAAARRRPQ